MFASERVIQISSIGGLAITINGNCIGVHNWKSPKAYHLLATIVALGGRNIPIGSIYDAIWSDLDGDKAMQNLEFILRRLRQTLHKCTGNSIKPTQIIQLHNGKISLNPEHCALDIWSWQAYKEQARHWRQDGNPLAARKIEQVAASILSGEFLAGDDELTIHQRQHWHTRFCNWIHETIDYWKEDDGVSHAEMIALLDVALGIDPCSEKLCMQRMNILLDEGYSVDAMRAFKDWAALVKEVYGLQPSKKIHRAFENISNNNGT